MNYVIPIVIVAIVCAAIYIPSKIRTDPAMWRWELIFWISLPICIALTLIMPNHWPELARWAPPLALWYINGRRDQQRGTGHTCQYETTSEIFAWGKLRPRTLHCTIKNCRSEQTITYDTASRATTKEEA